VARWGRSIALPIASPVRNKLPSQAQLALLRLLSLVVGGRERAHELISFALRASGHRDLPREPAELCSFARAHLTYGLIAELGPRIAATTLDELTRELLRGEGNVPPRNDDDAPDSTVRGIDSRAAAESSPLARIATQPGPASTEEFASGVRPTKVERPKVAIVEPNAFVRSSLSRALVRAGYDVVAIDKVDQLQAGDVHAAVLVSMRGADVDASLTAILALDPPVALVAYFADETNLAALRRTGATSAIIVSALSPLDQVVASVAAAIDAPPPSSLR
jgi:hypothetical protein